MRIFKNKAFNRWARKTGLTADDLRNAAKEVADGNVEGDLGGKVFKKRVALNAGKSGGARAIVCYQCGKNIFYVYGYEKNQRTNIKDDELKALKELAKTYLAYSEEELDEMVEDKTLFEIKVKKAKDDG
jgi:hypothetical protein